MFKFLFYFLLLNTGSEALAQLTPGTRNQNINAKKKAEKGTYQVIISHQKTPIAFADEFLIFIEENRDPEKDKTIRPIKFVEVYIPSLKSIRAADYRPLEEFVYP